MRLPASRSTLWTAALLSILTLAPPQALPASAQDAGAPGNASCVTGCQCSGSTPYCLHDISASTSQCVDGHARPLMPPLLFVHMPKTGGTTFHIAAEALLGKGGICGDYGSGVWPRSNRTVVHKDPGDRFLDPAKTACRLLTGHVKADTYVRDFGLRRTAVFLREPISRSVSSYHHQTRAARFNGTYDQFLDSHRVKRTGHGPGDFMSRALSAHELPLAAFGFVGLKERYTGSMRIFNDAYALDLHYSHENIDPAPGDLPPGLGDAALQQEFSPDIALYRQAQALFAERLRLLSTCRPYAHGMVHSIEGGVVRGWAWWAHSDDEVEVAVVVGGVLAAVARAREPHRLGEWGAPRDGDVGFEAALPANNGSEVCVFVRGTGQYLGPGLRHSVPVTSVRHPCHEGVALSTLPQ